MSWKKGLPATACIILSAICCKADPIVSASTLIAAAPSDQGAGASPVRLIKAGDVFSQLRLPGIARRADLDRIVDNHMREVAYHIKVDKGETLRWSSSWHERDVVVSDYLDITPEDTAAYKKQVDALAFPEPPRAEYRIRFVALRDFTPGQPLPTRLEAEQDAWIADKGIFLARVTMNEMVVDKTLPDVKLGLSALKLLANAVRAKLRALGVPEPYASQRVPMAVTELEGLGAAMKLGKSPNVELVAYSDSPVWTRDYTAVRVTWKAFGTAREKGPK